MLRVLTEVEEIYNYIRLKELLSLSLVSAYINKIIKFHSDVYKTIISKESSVLDISKKIIGHGNKFPNCIKEYREYYKKLCHKLLSKYPNPDDPNMSDIYDSVVILEYGTHNNCCNIRIYGGIQGVENRIANKKITLALNSGCNRCFEYTLIQYGIKEQVIGYFNETARNLIRSLPSHYLLFVFVRTVLTDLWTDDIISLFNVQYTGTVVLYNILKCTIINKIIMNSIVINKTEIEIVNDTFKSYPCIFDYEYILDDYINICDDITGIPNNNDFINFVEKYKPLK